MDEAEFERAVERAGLQEFQRRFPDALRAAAMRVEANRAALDPSHAPRPTAEPAHVFVPLSGRDG